MTRHQPGRARVSDADRETVARQLATLASTGRITSGDLEQRLTRLHEARSYDELADLVADVPEAQEAVQDLVAEQLLPQTLHISAPLLDVGRRGRWEVPARITPSAGRGRIVLDFTEALIDHEQVTIDARPNVGTIELIVPEGMVVSVQEAAPGGSHVHNHARAEPRPDAPRIHILARCGLGCVVARHPARRAVNGLPRRSSARSRGEAGRRPASGVVAARS